MTKQEYWEKIQVAAVDGTFPSREGDECCYRLDGTAECKQRCVVGLLIPDDRYSSVIEECPVHDKDVRRLIDRPEGVTYEMLAALQTTHDELEEWNSAVFLTEAKSILFP